MEKDIKRKKIFFDSEFTGLRKDTDLISIGLISEDGRTFYAEFNDYDPNKIDKWIQENVIDNLEMNEHKTTFITDKRSVSVKGNKSTIAMELKNWLVAMGPSLEIWSDCLSYDWVLFCDIFGGAFNIPSNVYYIPFDLATLFKEKGIDPDINREEFSNMDKRKSKKKHHALWDAKVIRECYYVMTEYEEPKYDMNRQPTGDEKEDSLGKYIIVTDLNFSDFMKDENGKMSIYDSYEKAYTSCWINEPEDALILKVVSRYIEPLQ